MKQITSLVLFLMAGTTAGAQIVKTAGIPYTATAPSHTPSASGSWWALDTANLDLYAYYGGSWKLAGERIQSISGCTGPAYVPGKGQALFVINACDSLYYYRSSAWRHINKGGGGVGTDTSGYNLSFTRVADTLYLTDGAGTLSVVLPSGSVDTDDQTLSIDSAAIADGERFALSISDGNTVYFEDTDTQNISISNDTISIERGGFVVLPPSVAADTSGYNTALTYSGDTLTVTDGNGALSVVIPGADGNGIYSGDGTIPANTTATLTSTRAFWIDYSNGVPAIQISDATGTGNGVTISNRNNNGELIVNNTQIEARAPNLLISGTGGGPGVLRIKETIGGSDYTQFTTGAQSGNILYTLPTATGQNGEVLKWTTGGQLVWDSIITTDAQTLSIDSTTTGGVERFSVAISNGNTVSFDVPQGVFLTDGDKNDIDVSGDGATWTIDTSAVTSIKIAADAIDSTKIAAGAISVTDIGQHSASSGQVLKWNGTQWAPANDATGSAGTGEANVGANLGAGVGVYEGKVDTILRFKSLTEGYGLDLTGSATEINIKVDTAQLATVNDINIVQADIDAHEAADGDLSATNEGALDVAAGGANSSVITSNTSGSPAVTIAGGVGIAVSETADTITITNTLTLDGNGIYSGSGTVPPNTLASAPNGFKIHNNNAGTIQIGDTTTNGARLEASYNYAGFNSDNYTWGMYVDRENVNMVINSPENDIQFGASDVLLSIQSGSSGFLIQDSRASTFGIEYADDYSATIKTNDRCIPDVGAVKSLISDSLAMVSGGSDGNGIYSGSDTISEGTLASFGEELGNAPAFGVGNFPNWPDFANDGTDNGLMMSKNDGNPYYNYQTLISSAEVGDQFGEPARSFVRVSPDAAQLRYIAKRGGLDNAVRSFFGAGASEELTNGGRIEAEIFARDDAGNRLSNIEFAMEAGDTAYVGTRHPFAKITATKEGASVWEFGMGQAQQNKFADISSATDTLNYRFYVGAQKYDAFGDRNYGYHTFRVDMPNDTAAHKVSLYNKSYYFPNEVPSAAAGDTAVMAWADGVPMWLDKSDFGVGGGVSDGDKGDIDVTASGATWTVDTSAITTIKIAANAIDSTKIGAGAISITDIGQHGAASGEVLKWNGAQWAPATDNTGGGGGIDSTSARNTGASGEGVYSHEAANVLNFKKLIAGSNITLTPADSSITIAATGGGASDGNGIYSSDDTITVNRTVTVDEDSLALFTIKAKDNANSYIAYNPLYGSGIQQNDHGVYVFDNLGFGGDGVTIFSNPSTTQIKLHNDSIQIKVNGDDGAAGQVLKSNGSFVYWGDDATGGGSPSVITPSTITSDQDNYSPTGWATATIVRISGDSMIRAITGFASAGIADGHEKKIINVGSYPVYIPGDHPDSEDSNRVSVGYDYIVYPKSTAVLVYDNTLNRWVIASEIGNRPKTQTYEASPGSTTGGDWGNLAVPSAFNSGSVSTSAGVNNVFPAAWTMTTSATASSGASMGFPKVNSGSGTYGDSHQSVEAYISLNGLSVVSDTFYAGVRFAPANGQSIPTQSNSIGIIYSHIHNSGNWSLVSVDNSGTPSAYIDLGVAAAIDAPVLLRLEVDKALTEARAYIDGVYVGRVTTNLPNSTSVSTNGGNVIIRKSVTGTGGDSLRVHSLKSSYIFD